MWVDQLVFYFFSVMLVIAAVMVVVPRNPVWSALFLVLAFFCSAVLWMLLQAEFLSLVLIFVYVGAVMTLFLFVVMMLNVDIVSVKQSFVRYLPFAVLVMALLIGAMIITVNPKHFPVVTHLVRHGADYSNTRAMGNLLFTHYLYAFELAAVLLLVAIIAAIALAFDGRKANAKAQDIVAQQQTKVSDRLRIVKMKVEKK